MFQIQSDILVLKEVLVKRSQELVMRQIGVLMLYNQQTLL